MKRCAHWALLGLTLCLGDAAQAASEPLSATPITVDTPEPETDLDWHATLKPGWDILLRHYGPELLGMAILLLALLFFAQRARRAQRLAQDSAAQTTQFMAMMSHEIRTPMNAVLSSVELLLYSRLDTRQRELAALANSSALSLLELLDDVLDVARLDARQLRLNLGPTDMEGLARGAADVHRPGAQAKGLALNFDSQGLERLDLWVDPVRVRQVLSNLLSNAVKFTSYGAVGLQLRLQRHSDTSATLRIDVSDSGIGVDADQQATLFSAFTQADSSKTRRYGGFGLGLSICKQLVDLMQGTIELHSVPSLGTLVTVSLPVQVASRASEPSAPPLSAPSAIAAATRADQWVLVIEDQRVNQQAIDLQMASLECRTTIVDDGPAALKVLETEPWPDLILLDCYLPGMDGYEVARRIRALEVQRGRDPLPIIAISAATDEAHRLRCVECGMDGNLAKPLRLGDLAELLQFWLRDDEPAPALPTFTLSAEDTASLRRMFAETSLEDLNALEQAVIEADLDEACHRVHRLHGAALTMGAPVLAEPLDALEATLRQKRQFPPDCRYQVEQLREMLRAYCAQP